MDSKKKLFHLENQVLELEEKGYVLTKQDELKNSKERLKQEN